MLGQALSFALVQQRFEPLHATVVVVDDRAIAFLGENGSGKSTLAACWLAAGCRLLTDDLLILQQTSDGVLAYPGPPRIKLFPQIASRFLGAASNSVPMNPDTAKLILPLEPDRRCATPVPLEAIYVVAPARAVSRSENVRIQPLSPRDGF